MFELRPYRSNNATPSSWNPFREMEELEKRFFGTPFGGFFRSGDLAEFKTDITDQGESFLLEADLPGFDRKDIRLELVGDALVIHAERRSEHEKKDDGEKLVHMERAYGKYSREFDLSGVDTEKIKAKYKDGVLTLTLPKRQQAAPETKRLEIE